jgi:putative intracellular protease/amidase
VSLLLQFLSGSDKAVFGDPKHPFNVKLHSRLKKASELKSEDYGLFFASAGHAALYDYPMAKGLQGVAADFWDRVKEDKVTLVVDAVTGAGGFYSSSMGAMDDYSITCGRLVTGTNPASARSAAERAVKAFDSL